MTERKHTELPWMVESVRTSIGECHKILKRGVVDNGHRSIACLYDDHTTLNEMADYEQKANAEFIVRACNNHYALIEALEELTAALENNIHVSAQEHELEQLAYANGKALSALKQAKGESE